MQLKSYASLLVTVMLITNVSYGQNEKIFNKLNSLYTLDKFEECIAKAENYMKDSKDGKDAYPYLYASMSYFAIHQNGSSTKKMKDPLRKAVSNAGKFLKRDKKEELKTESAGYLDQLRRGVLHDFAYLVTDADQKATLQNLAREVVKSYPKDFPLMLSAGTYLMYAGSKPEGEKAVQAAMDSLKKRTPVTDSIFQVDYANAFLLYTTYLADNKDAKKAKDVIKFATTFCPGNEALKSEYDRLYDAEATNPK